jgi:hypothetical protein
VQCHEFLDRHSEFRDGLVTAREELRRFREHLARCAACRRYDATVRRGVQALHASAAGTPIVPSPGFRERLEQRLAWERAHGSALPSRAGFTAALVILVALALLILEAGHRPTPPRAAPLPPVAFPKPVVNPGLPFVSFQDPRAGVLQGNPHPYGTALVQPSSTR